MKIVKLASIRERVYRKGFYDKGICYECKKNPRDSNLSTCISCRNKMRQYNKQWRQESKITVFNAYGGPVCNCCGEAELLMLSLDHINNDGAKHRREINCYKRSGDRTYRWLIKNNFPTGYQVLCHNCNFAKHLNGGICPHKTKQTLTAQ